MGSTKIMFNKKVLLPALTALVLGLVLGPCAEAVPLARVLVPQPGQLISFPFIKNTRTSFTAVSGTKISIPIVVADADLTATLLLLNTPLPTGATISPASGKSPATFVLSWSPLATNIGKT